MGAPYGGAAPERIVSLSASNTEILCALGLEERLVGVDTWSDYPPSVRQLPKVGRELDIDVAAVTALRPDLVVACLSVPGMERNLPRLAAAHLPYVALRPVGLDSIFDNILRAGAATGRERRAAELVAGLQARLTAVERAVAPTAPRPRVYWEWYPKPLVAAGGRSWMTRLIAMAGGENIFADCDAESTPVQLADVLARQPDVIVACWCGARTPPTAERVAARPGWEPARAAREGRVYVVPEGLFARPGPRLADGLELLAALLHPDGVSKGAGHA
jgi:iron complex transport system substrate-binding protein